MKIWMYAAFPEAINEKEIQALCVELDIENPDLKIGHGITVFPLVDFGGGLVVRPMRTHLCVDFVVDVNTGAVSMATTDLIEEKLGAHGDEFREIFEFVKTYGKDAMYVDPEIFWLAVEYTATFTKLTVTNGWDK